MPRSTAVVTASTVLVTLALFATAACSPSQSDPADHSLQVVDIPASWAVGMASSLETLSSSADAVFVGEVVSGASSRLEPVRRETAGDYPSVPDKQAPKRVPSIPMATFEVRIVDSLKGVGPAGATVRIEQVGGLLASSSGGEQRVQLEGDSRLITGTEYLFFSFRKPDGSYTSAPFARFPIVDGLLTGEAGWEQTGALVELQGSSIDQATGLVARHVE